MHANLMRAARVQVRFDQRKCPQTQTHAPIGARFAPFAATCRHARAAMQIARDGQFDLPLSPFALP